MTPLTTWAYCALTNGCVGPAHAHRLVWDWAVRDDDRQMQADLIGRPDAPADLVAHYATLTDPQLRAAYLSRRDTDPDTEYTGPTTATALAVALRNSQYATPVLAVAIDRFQARPTRVLGEALLTVPAPARSCDLAQALYAFADTLLLEQLRKWRGPLSEHHLPYLTPQAAVALTQTLGRAVLVADVFTLPVPDEHVHAALTRIGAPLAASVGTSRSRSSSDAGRALGALWRSAVTHDRDPDHVDSLLLAEFADPDGPDVRHARLICRTATGPRRDRTHQARGRTPQAAAALTDRARAAELTDLSWWAASPHPEVVAACVDRFMAAVAAWVAADTGPGSAGRVSPDWVGKVAAVLLDNPGAGPDGRLRVARTVASLPAETRTDPPFDVIARWPGDSSAGRVWCDAWPAAVLKGHGWAPFDAHQPREVWLAAWSAAARTDNDRPARYALRAAAATGLTPGQLRLLPWPLFDAFRNQGTAGAIMELLSATFADRPGAWRVLDQVGPTFDGTLGDLLDVCLAAT